KPPTRRMARHDRGEPRDIVQGTGRISKGHPLLSRRVCHLPKTRPSGRSRILRNQYGLDFLLHTAIRQLCVLFAQSQKIPSRTETHADPPDRKSKCETGLLWAWTARESQNLSARRIASASCIGQ